MKINPIEKLILSSERNLRVASAVSEAWPEARGEIVVGFLKRLDSRVKRQLSGWKSGPWGGKFFVDSNPGYYCWKPAWEGQYSIALQCQNYGARMVLGVGRDTVRPRNQAPSDELLSEVAKYFPSAAPHRWWEARVTLQSPARDWGRPDVLWRMHKERAFLRDVAGQFRQMAKLSEPIIDQMAKKQRKAR